LDDFGMGHSSLSLLRDLQFDEIKIDRSFVTHHVFGGPNERYLRAIIGLGRSLDLKVTAEGIETSETMRALRDLGCAIGQGYLFGRPVPAADVAKLIEKFAR
jgi:EAL domain-containing protein (putative c-di-GMP-specific phosphodiesterase class I)